MLSLLKTVPHSWQLRELKMFEHSETLITPRRWSVQASESQEDLALTQLRGTVARPSLRITRWKAERRCRSNIKRTSRFHVGAPLRAAMWREPSCRGHCLHRAFKIITLPIPSKSLLHIIVKTSHCNFSFSIFCKHLYSKVLKLNWVTRSLWNNFNSVCFGFEQKHWNSS